MTSPQIDAIADVSDVKASSESPSLKKWRRDDRAHCSSVDPEQKVHVLDGRGNIVRSISLGELLLLAGQ
jgi:hypothetical protein